MLARYKKGGGIVELVKLVEDSSEPKRSQLMAMIRTEDPEFAARVEAKIFNFDKLKTLPEGLLAEIIGETPPKFVALGTFGEAPEFVVLVEKCLGKNFNEYKEERENLKAAPPPLPQIESGRRKIIAEARKLEASGKIKLGGNDLDSAGSTTGSSIAALTPAQGGAAKLQSGPPGGSGTANPMSGPIGSATADAGCPPVTTFGIEPPPPGLSGERFETFLKSLLS